MSDTSLYFGADLGRSTRLAIIDEAGEVRHQRRVQTNLTSGRALVDGLVAAIKQGVEDAAPMGRIRAVGLGLPGLVERPSNRVVMLPNLVDVGNIDVFGEVSSATQLPVVFDNDANAATYGEWKGGAGRGVNDLIYITLGTGIGAGLIQGGVLQRGSHGFAGEFGHLKVTPDGMECSCGSSGCLETFASGPNIVRRTRERLFSDANFAFSPLAEKMRGKLSCEDVIEGAVAGDRLARTILAETGLYLGTAVANVVNLLNVEMVVLGGPVMRSNKVLLDAVIEEASRRAFGPSFATVKMRPGELGDDAGVLGAAMMARDFTGVDQIQASGA